VLLRIRKQTEGEKLDPSRMKYSYRTDLASMKWLEKGLIQI